MKCFSVLFVCLGNICRSPTAEGVFRSIAEESLKDFELMIDSAGTTGYHAGEHADQRMIKSAQKRGYDLSRIISRPVIQQDYEMYDLIIAMDKENKNNLIRHALDSGNERYSDKIKLFLEFSQQAKYSEVPDPYYGGSQGFDLVIDLIEDASQGLIRYVTNK